MNTTGESQPPDRPEAVECLTPGCEGRMQDVQPLETARADNFVLVRIECDICHARAWRIQPPSPSDPES